MYTGYEARLSAEQASKKEVSFEVICPGQKSYLVSKPFAWKLLFTSFTVLLSSY